MIQINIMILDRNGSEVISLLDVEDYEFWSNGNYITIHTHNGRCITLIITTLNVFIEKIKKERN